MILLRPGSAFGSIPNRLFGDFLSKNQFSTFSTDNFCDKLSELCLLDKMVTY